MLANELGDEFFCTTVLAIVLQVFLLMSETEEIHETFGKIDDGLHDVVLA